jgi:hypothetical protein
MADDARYILANHLFSNQPLDEWDVRDLLDAGLVKQDELEALPDADPTLDPRTYWKYIGTRWDVTFAPEGQPLLVPADVEGLDPADPTAELRRWLEAYLRPPHEPLSEADVRAMATLGIAPESDFENRGGGCVWHRSIPEE